MIATENDDDDKVVYETADLWSNWIAPLFDQCFEPQCRQGIKTALRLLEFAGKGETQLIHSK